MEFLFNPKKLIFLTLIISILPSISYSCESDFSKGSGFSVIMDYNLKETKITGRDGKNYLPQKLTNCEINAGKYLKISMGLEVPALSSKVFGTFYDSNPNFFFYEIKDSKTPFHFDTKEIASADFFKNQKQLETCIDIKIKDSGNDGLEFLEPNGNCQTRINGEDNSTIISSGTCIFKIKNNSNFEIGLQENKNCINDEFFKREGLRPGDFGGRIRFELGEVDNNKVFKRERSVGTIPLNFQIKEGLDFYKSLKLPGRVSDPIWVMPDIQFHKIKIEKAGDNATRIDFSLLLDNNSCEAICKAGICTSPCNFLSPFSAEVTFSETNKNEYDYELANSFIGEKIPPNWKGLVDGLQPLFIQNYDLSVGKKYKLKLLITDPYLGYLQYKKEFKKSLAISRGNFNLSEGTEIASLGVVNSNFSIRDLSMNNADFAIGAPYGDVLTIGERSLGFSALSENKDWPPVYSFACNKNYSNCKKPDSENLGMISAVFEIIGEKEGSYEIRLIETERKSKINSEFKVEGGALPKIFFGNREI